MEGAAASTVTMNESPESHDDAPSAPHAPAAPPDAPDTPDAPVEITPQRVVEAVLFASDAPMPAAKIASVLGVGDARDVRRHVEALNAGYAETGSAFRIEEIAGGYQMMTLPAYNAWLVKLLRARQETKLTPAALEALAVVAYKQPCTRADIEAIRGVACGDVLNRLREMNLVKIVGRAEDLGRPMLYGTTRRFLEVFGLPGLEDLPRVEALRSGAGAASQTAPPTIDASTDDDAEAAAEEPGLHLVESDGEAEGEPLQDNQNQSEPTE